MSHRDALICDMAEYYHIYDYESMPPSYIATLVCGLRDGSRCISALTGNPYPMNTMLTCGILDTVKSIAWMNSADGAKNRNRPKSVFEILFPKETDESMAAAFESGEAFEAARRKILGE